jgi:hypothetical protein
MIARLGLGVLLLTVVALVIMTYAGPVTSSAPAAAPPARGISASRFFMLQPDGKVEITDGWARRVYRWDGRVWVELEVKKLGDDARH